MEKIFEEVSVDKVMKEELEKYPYPFLWDGSIKETLQTVKNGICKEIDSIREVVEADYIVVAKFEQVSGSMPENVWCNGRGLMHRKKKFGPVLFGNEVELLEGTPTSSGGSNTYPVPYFKENYCVIRFKTKGVPILNRYAYRWRVTILSLVKMDQSY